MNRLARLVTIVTTFVATMALSAPAALASAPPPQPGTGGTQTIPAPALVHTASGGSGVGTWTVLLIALGAVVLGVVVDELRRAISRHHHASKFATA